MIKKHSSKTVELMLYGNEPDKTLNMNDSGAVQKALHYYYKTSTHKKGKEWLIQYLTKTEHDKVVVANISSLSDRNIPSNVRWYGKLALNGSILTETQLHYVSEQISELNNLSIKLRTQAEKKPEKKPVNLQERTNKSIQKIITSAEAFIDTFIENGEEISMYNFLKINIVSPIAAKALREFYKPLHEEIMLDDEQIKESYGKSLKKWQNFWKSIIDDLDRYIGNKQIVKERKPRVTKVVPLEKIVESVKYKKEDAALKLVSVPPSKIIGAQQVWFFNTKYRSLGVYNAGPEGLGIKGTTITGFDEATSMSKGARKPEEATKMVLEATKITLKQVMNKLKTTPRTPNGRLNIDTIILRVI